MSSAGPKALFVVVITDPGPKNEVTEAITSLDSHRIQDNTYLVSTELLVKDLADRIGIGQDQKGSGIAFRADGTHWGRSDMNTWDWLSRNRHSM